MTLKIKQNWGKQLPCLVLVVYAAPALTDCARSSIG